MKLGKFKVEGPIVTMPGVVNAGSRCQEYPTVDYEACIIYGTRQRYCSVDAITIGEDQEDCVTFTWGFCEGRGIYTNECPRACMKMMPVGGGR